jgi:hypothetical protein
MKKRLPVAQYGQEFTRRPTPRRRKKMTSRNLDLTISAANVTASLEQFLCATKQLTLEEEFKVSDIEYNPKTKEFRFKGVAEKLEDVSIRQLN